MPNKPEETPAVEENTKDSQPSESTESTDTSTEVDEDALYQTELDRIRQEKAEKARRKAAYTVRQEAKAEENEAEEDDIDTKLNRFKDEILGTITATTKQSQYEQRINEVATGKEAELIREILDSGTVSRTGNVQDDVANARAIANKHRLDKLVSEVQRAGNSSRTATSNTAGTQETVNKPEVEMTPDEAILAERLKNWQTNG